MSLARPAPLALGLRRGLASQYVTTFKRPQHRLLQSRLHQAARKSPTPPLIQRRFQTISVAPPPPRRSVLIRTVRTLAGASFWFITGMFIGWWLFPAKDAIRALLSEPPTDEQTTSMFTPPDAESARINTHITQHALSRALRDDPAFTESRPHMKIPEALRRMNLTGGTLAGPGRIVVPPLQFIDDKGHIVSIFYLGEQLCGHPTIVHGGLLATLLDEGLARACFPLLEAGIAVTANLKIDYRRPVKANRYYVLRATTQKIEGRKAWVKGWIEELGDDADEVGAQGVKGFAEGEGPPKGEANPATQKLVEAEALYIEPKNAGILKRLYQP